MKTLLNQFCFILIFIASIVNAQWSTTIETDGEYTNQGNMLAALEDRNGGVFVVYVRFEYQQTYTSEIPYFFHIDKYGYKTKEDVEPPRINDIQRNIELVWSSDGNLFLGSRDNLITDYYDGLPNYRPRATLMKIDTNGYALWDEPVLITVDTVEHDAYQLEPDREGGCYVSVSKDDRKMVQKISPDGERLWGDQGVILYEGRQANGLQNYPPNIHLRSDDKLFVHTITNIYSPSKVNLISSTGEILAEAELDSSITTFNSYLNSDDELLHLGFHGGYSDRAEDLILDKFSVSGNSIESEKITIMDQIDYGMGHMNSMLVENNIHMLWSYWSGEENIVHYQVITSSYNTVFDSLGYPIQTSKFIVQDSITTFKPYDIEHLFRIDLEGIALWGEEGKRITLDDCLSASYKLVTDGNQGVIVLWNSCVSGVRAKLINKNGELGIVTEVRGIDNQIPNNFFVSSNYPNPFNPSTSIDYYLPVKTDVQIKVINLLGEVVYKTTLSNKLPGNYSFQFDADNLATGIYFVVFAFNNKLEVKSSKTFIKKIMLLK